jgi:hypothetical protein
MIASVPVLTTLPGSVASSITAPEQAAYTFTHDNLLSEAAEKTTADPDGKPWSAVSHAGNSSSIAYGYPHTIKTDRYRIPGSRLPFCGYRMPLLL